jgi:phosphoribosylformylglycinamidine synthase
MTDPFPSPGRVEAALGRSLDAAERAALAALEDGAPLPPPEAAPPPATQAPAADLPTPADLEAVLLVLLAAPAGAGPEARAEVVAVAGVAVALARGGARARLDPRHGGALAALEAAGWLACRGAAPEGAAAAVEGLAGASGWLALQGAREVCEALRIPLRVPRTETLPATRAGAGEPGSLAVAVAGRSGDAIAAGFVADGDAVVLLGTVGGGGPLGGSAYASEAHGAVTLEAAGAVPAPDLTVAGAVLDVVRRAARAGLLSSARPVARGGLAVALAEACAATGAAVRIPFAWPKDRVLFGEEPGRVLVSLPVTRFPALEALARERGAPMVRLGAVGGDQLEAQAALSVALEELLAARAAGEGATAGRVPEGTARA